VKKAAQTDFDGTSSAIVQTKERGRPRDRGKAEECFREALTLNNKHFLSLLALACLMWHRNYCTQSEVLLRTAIDLHTEEEWLCWCILSQVYYAQGQKDNEKSCIRKAEMLYKASRGNRNAYTAPHILLNPLLKFPFSVGYLFIQEKYPTSTVYVETALLLLDLYLQKEGKQILDLECDVFSTAFDNKWAQAKAHELNKEYTKAEIWIKENLNLTREDPMSWLCLGRIRYVNKKYTEALEAYEKVRTCFPEWFLRVIIIISTMVAYQLHLHSKTKIQG
jgi:tetratricopeptide (TPR) repeat protein